MSDPLDPLEHDDDYKDMPPLEDASVVSSTTFDIQHLLTVVYLRWRTTGLSVYRDMWVLMGMAIGDLFVEERQGRGLKHFHMF